MAIDISTDLNITLQYKDILTHTISNNYDLGSPPDTYVPGKDFSPIDFVSIGTTANYNFSIAFESISNQLYNLDEVYIQSMDDPRSDGTGSILGYWINQNPDPHDIVDDGLNVPVPNYNSQMSSIVFGSTANIKSNSTLTTAITVTLPVTGFYWKTKIMPEIQVVAIKDGIKKVSAHLQFPTVRLSTAGELRTSMQANGQISYLTLDGQTGFRAPFFVSTSTQYLSDISKILDKPDFDLITYSVKYSALVNGTPIALTNSNFIIPSVANGELVSLSYANEILTIVMRQTAPGEFLFFNVFPFIPFDASQLNQATIVTNTEWNTPLPTITGFVNEYLFTIIQDGSASQSQIVQIVPIPPVEKPTLQESINGSLSAKSVFQSLNFSNYNCFNTTSSVIIRLIDSPISSFGESLAPTLFYYDLTTDSYTQYVIPQDSYVALYAHYDLPVNYDANLIGQQVLNGIIALKTYQEVLSEGLKPNIATIGFTQNIFAQVSVDLTKGYSFNFNGQMPIISKSEFKMLYDTDPRDSYPSYLYSYMSLSSCYLSVQAANEAEGALLYATDFFELRNGLVYLNLGTTSKNGTNTVERFNAISVVKYEMSFNTVDANLEYALYTSQGGYVNTVTDYTKSYCVFIRWTSQAQSDNAYINMPADETISIVLEESLVPYLYISDIPYINVPIGDSSIETQVPIADYSLDGNTLTLALPIEINLMPNYICVPVKFIIPYDDLTTGMSSMDFSGPLYYKQDPESLIYGFNTDSKMFVVNTFTRSFTLKGAQQDNTGLSITPEIYERGQSVTYMAVVNNVSYSPSSDYYMSMTVPTNKYNPLETTNNDLPTYITGIDPKTDDTTVYYQIEPNVTAQDILIMKTVNRPGGPTLEEYYNNVIINSWIKYIPVQILQDDIVMMVSYTPGVGQGASPLRVDYQVTVDLPEGSNQIYTNNAVFNYYSLGANLESQSNDVQIRNRIAEAIPVIKAPLVQVKNLENGVPILFATYFTAPSDNTVFEEFTVIDELDPSLTFDPFNTKVTIYPSIDEDFGWNIDEATNTVSIQIQNTDQMTGKLVIVTIATILTDSTKVKIDPEFNQLLIKNTADLLVNNNPDLKLTSNVVYVVFSVPVPPTVPVIKSPNSQSKPLQNGIPVTFTASFTAPSDINTTTLFSITDILHQSLTADTINMSVKSGGVDVPFTLNIDLAQNSAKISFANNALTAGKTVTVTIAATLSDVTKVPPSMRVENQVSLTLNGIANFISQSNIVEVIFSQPLPCRQDVTDIIESIALEQTALSHILNAEGEKIQRALGFTNVSQGYLIEVNHSVEKTVNSIANLETVLKDKLELFKDNLCPQNCIVSENDINKES